MFNVFVLSCSLSKATNRNYYDTVCCFFFSRAEVTQQG